LADRLLATGEDITFSGGDPMFQAETFGELAATIKSKSNRNIWCYTGFRIEQLLKNPKTLPLLQNIDVLVDGQFELALRDENLLFRGSSNQRLIDVQKTLERGEIVMYEPINLLSPLLMKYKINA
jgi:anaerobic ribonucleoside-triphosphate reductase activating protein